MQTALKILSKRPELAERTASGAAEHGAPQPEPSRLSRQVSYGAPDQAEQVSGQAAQHAGHIHPGPIVNCGVAGSRLARETSAAEALAAEAALQAEVEAAEDIVGAPSSGSAAAAPQADGEAEEADEPASLPKEGVALEQVTGPAHQLPPVEAEQPEREASHVSTAPSPATEADIAADAVQHSQSVEPALAEGIAQDASGQQPAQPDKMLLPKADDSARLKEPSPVVSRSPGIAGDLSRKRERSMALEKLEEQEKPLRGSPARQGSISGTGQPSKAPELPSKLQKPLPEPVGRQATDAGAASSVPEAKPSQMPSTAAAVASELAATAQEATNTTPTDGSRTALLASADGATETTALTSGIHAESADAESDTLEVAVSAATEQDTSSTAGTAAGPAVSVMPDGQRPAPDASAVRQAVESERHVAATGDGPAAAAHMQVAAAHEQLAAASEAHSPTGSSSRSQTAPCETPPPADDVSPTEEPKRQMPPSADVAEGNIAPRQPSAADKAFHEMASAELLCEEVLPETPPQAPRQGISSSHPSTAVPGPELPGAQICAADPAEAGGAPQDSPNIAAALLKAGSSITVRVSKHKRPAVGTPADVLPVAAEEAGKDKPPHTAVSPAPQTAASLGASAPADALKTVAQGLYGDAVPLATAEKPTDTTEAVKPTAEVSPTDPLVAAESADEELDKHDEPCDTAPPTAESAPVKETLRGIEPLTAAPDAEQDDAAVNAPDANMVITTFIPDDTHKQLHMRIKDLANTIGFDKLMMSLDALHRCMPLRRSLWRVKLRKSTLEKSWPIGYLEVLTTSSWPFFCEQLCWRLLIPALCDLRGQQQ